MIPKNKRNKMLGIAEASILGRAVAPPETNETPAGPVMKIRLAVNERRKNGEHASFFSVDVWNEKAQAALAALEKGEILWCHCSVRHEQYAGKNGDKITATRFTMDKFRFVSSKQAEESIAA